MISQTHTHYDCKANLHSSSRLNLQLNPYQDVEIEGLREILRQARRSFDLQFIAIASSMCIGIMAGGLMLANRTTEGSMTAAAGLLSSGICTQIKASQDKLTLLTQRLENLHSDESDR
jgi:hypothetical protein